MSLAAVYVVAGKIGLRFAMVHPSATAIWAPTGIALSACLMFGQWVWPGILAGAFLVHVTTTGSMATSIGISAGNTFEALLGCYFIERYANGRNVFRIEIDGHTDAIGSLSYNRQLSEARAKTVKDWLVTREYISASTPITGYGKIRPISPNTNPDGSDNPIGRQKNRRVEILIDACK
jgi:integral membrane sensor domain MASE1